MVRITVKTSTIQKTDTFSPNASPADALDSFGIVTAGNVIRLNGAVLGQSELSKSFADLGVQEGDSAILSAIVKADGANK